MFQSIDFGRLQTCVFDRWSPQIGDPSLGGWLTVAAYLICAVLALLVLRRIGGGRTRTFWVLICIVMAFLAVNKQLDLQSALTATGRCISRLQGWYEDRRVFQRHFIQGLLLVVGTMLALGLYLMRRDLKRNGLALLGLAVVAGFVAVRAVGFHHFDSVINMRVQDVRLNVVFELAGLVLIAVNALALLLRQPGRQRARRV
ncbi:MAG: hypothetical protein ACK4MS_00770 [Paracoccaceae bacterium]